MQGIKEAAAEFLAGRRIAVTGVSRHPESHGANVVYRRLRDRGYEVFAVNPNADEVEGDRAYHALADIPGGVDGVVIATRPEAAEATVRECADLGISHVWMHRGPGGGSVSADAAAWGREHGHHGHRRRLPVHVRTHRRRRAPDDADGVHAHRECAPPGLIRRAPPGRGCADRGRRSYDRGVSGDVETLLGRRAGRRDGRAVGGGPRRVRRGRAPGGPPGGARAWRRP